MKSRVHPTYETHNRVGNWRAYKRALVRRGDVTLWLTPDARAAWGAAPSGRPGGQQRFSDLAIGTLSRRSQRLDVGVHVAPAKGPMHLINEDGKVVATWTALERARSRDHRRGNARAAPMAEGLGLSSAGPRRERLLSLQVHHWRRPSRPESAWPERRGEPCLSCPESDDRAWHAPVVCDQPVTRLWVGECESSVEPCTNAYRWARRR
ncbi:hypothetical protein LuPra_00872 [Luteitalea pratensis]|uniref:Transposase DDE domain-containing protein n=1 Tax=Luteitalea pratensis TaxID=1855912 RepID=A0A143PIV0_LUTPR|nr:hypothetical protein LuPra_00872 [Luteitalea pratensis]